MKPSSILPQYPKEIENWWWKNTLQKWPEHSEEKILNLIRKEIVLQSDRFNKLRSFDSKSYGSRDLSILAYGNFFFPRTWNAMKTCASEALSIRGWNKPSKGPIRILDIGSGSGASGLSVLHLLKNSGFNNSVLMDAWDYSGKSLSFLKNIHKDLNYLWPKSKLQTKRIDLLNSANHKAKEKFDLIVMGFSLNEILESQDLTESVNWLTQITNLLSPNGFLIITEPAEKEVCKNLHRISAQISNHSKNYFLHAPYFNGLECPLIEGNSHFYSHEVRKNLTTERMAKINRFLRLEIHLLKFGFSIIGKRQPNCFPNDSSICRLVSPINKNKGTLTFIGIAGDGMEYRYEIQKRDIKPDEIKFLLKLERGDVLRFESLETGKEKNKIRIPRFRSISWPFSPRWS